MNKILTPLQRFFKSFAPIFTPPFDGLWLVALLYFFWCFLTLPHSPILRGDLPDPDDYMYLNQVMDWLKGQGWYDNINHRLDPPRGVPIHFSRLVQIPMAGMVMLFQHMGLPMRGAALVTALFLPLFWFAGLFAALRWMALSFMPRNWAGATAFVALFSYQLTYEYSPGHLDHHGLIIFILALVLGCLVRMIENPAQIRYALFAGGMLALDLIIGLEVLPSVLVMTTWLGLWAVMRGGQAGRVVAAYGVTFYLASLVGLLLTRAPANLWEMDVLTYSAVYVILAMGVAVCCAALAVTAEMRLWVRLLVAAIVTCVSGGWFLHAFPTLWAGPYGGLDPMVAQIIIGEMSETKPLLGHGAGPLAFLCCAGGIIVALIASVQILRSRWKIQGWSFGLIALMLLVISMLAIFYQRRFDGTAEMLAVIPLTILLQRGYAWIGMHLNDRSKVFAELGLLILVGPLTSVLIPAILEGRDLNAGVLQFPAYNNGNGCDLRNLEQILNDPRVYGDRPRLILNHIGMGPEILFRTNHEVLSAPYHMNVNGNLDAVRFFSTPFTSEAEAIVRRRHIDLVVMCRFVPDMYVRPAIGVPSLPGEHHRDVTMHMVERLMLNKQPPWLKRVDNGRQDFVLYEVLPPQAKFMQSLPSGNN